MNTDSNARPAISTANSNGSRNGVDGIPDQFPAGLRVLVVDDDPTCHKILERMLQSCLYEVTTCSHALVALSMLREKKDGFDIVISDVYMPDMDGFKLLEHIGLEMDLPVIMMSADDGKDVVMKGVTHGACDYLIKPVRMEAIKNIWQHVVRNMRKNCMVWSVDLHQQFVAAVYQLGIDKAVPKKILELMNAPGLTRENVASHLQKYRLYFKRLSGLSQHQFGLSAPFVQRTLAMEHQNLSMELREKQSAYLKRQQKEGQDGVDLEMNLNGGIIKQQHDNFGDEAERTPRKGGMVMAPLCWS